MSRKTTTDTTADTRRRKAYVKPRLERLGSLREVTTSASGRANEPGSGGGGGANPDLAKRRP